MKSRETSGKYIAKLLRMLNLYLNHSLKKFDLSSGVYIFLAELFDSDGCTQDELTQRIYVDKALTTRALTKLEQSGYIRREKDERDARINRIFLEQKALDIEDEFWEILLNWSTVTEQGMTTESRTVLISDLKEMSLKASDYLTHNLGRKPQ